MRRTEHRRGRPCFSYWLTVQGLKAAPVVAGFFGLSWGGGWEYWGLGGGRAIRADGLVAVGYVYGYRDRNPADSLSESIESGDQ